MLFRSKARIDATKAAAGKKKSIGAKIKGMLGLGEETEQIDELKTYTADELANDPKKAALHLRGAQRVKKVAQGIQDELAGKEIGHYNDANRARLARLTAMAAAKGMKIEPKFEPGGSYSSKFAGLEGEEPVTGAMKPLGTSKLSMGMGAEPGSKEEADAHSRRVAGSASSELAMQTSNKHRQEFMRQREAEKAKAAAKKARTEREEPWSV